MSQVDERVATQREKRVLAGGTATTGPSGQPPSTSSYGRRVQAAGRTTPDYGDPALNAQAQRHNESLAADAEELRRKEPFASPEAAAKAVELLKENEGEWDQERLDRGWARVKNYIASNPEAIQQFSANTEMRKWEDTYMDTSPAPSSRLINAQRQTMRLRSNTDDSIAGTMFMNDMLPMPESLEDLGPVTPDSREGIIDRLESEGVDTVSGIGGFWDNVGTAIKLNNSSAQAAAVLGMTMDNIEDAGIPLPDGLVPIRVNHDLGQLEVLTPNEEGDKLRRTLVDPEVMGLAGLGQLADLEELFAGIYAGTAAVRGVGATAVTGSAIKHPFLREFLGDYAGRNVGILLEAAISTISDEAELNDVVEALDWRGNVSETALNTAVSRGIARTGRFMTGGNKSFSAKNTAGSETEEVIDANIDEAAEILTDVNKLVEGSDNVLPYTVEAGSLSERAAQKVNARGSRITPTRADNIELMRRERIKTLSEANRRVAEKHAPADSLNYDAHTVTEEATSAVNSRRVNSAASTRRKYTMDEGIAVREGPNGMTSYTLRGETDRAAGKVKEGELAGEHGLRVIFSDDSVHIVDAFAGDKFEGATSRLFFKLLDDAGDRAITFGDSVSPSAQKAVNHLKRLGFDIAEHPGAKLDNNGNLTAPNLEPVYNVVGRPGQIQAPRLVADAQFDDAVMAAGINDIEELVPLSQMRADEANANLSNAIGWSQQRQISDYYVENSSRSGLNQMVRQLQNRVKNVLSGVEQREAEGKLGMLVRKEIDEDGDVFLTGLVDEQLDVGNLLNSRAKLNSIARETGDPEVARIVQTIDNLLDNQSYINRRTGRARPASTATAREAVTASRAAQAEMDEVTAMTNASKMFKRNADGELLNTDLQSMGRVLGNNSQFLQHMAPVLKRGPSLREPVRQALGELYQDQVLNRASGWSQSAHQRFLKKYSSAIEAAWTGPERNMITAYRPPTNTGVNRFESARQAADARWKRLVTEYAPDAETVNFSNPRDIVGSVNTMGPGRARAFMKELDKMDPELAANVRQTGIEQTRNELNTMFFDPNRPANQLQSGPALRSWYDERKAALKALHGDQYVTDLETVVRAHELDAKRAVVRGVTPPTQHDLLRVTRSIFGPLSPLQRRITAGNYVNNRRLAAKSLSIYSDPAMLRQLKQAKGIGARTEAGIAIGVRLGLFDAVGIAPPDNPNDPESWSPEFIEQVNDLYDLIDLNATAENNE